MLEDLDFDTLYAHPKIKKTLSDASRRFSTLLTPSERTEAMLGALFYAKRKYQKGRNTVFTTYLAKCVDWHCRRLAKDKYEFNKRHFPITFQDMEKEVYYDSKNIYLLLECLSESEKDLILKKYIYNYTFSELGKLFSVSGEMIRQRLLNIVSKIREANPNTTINDVIF